MSEKLDKEKCLCYLQVKGGEIVNRGKWGGESAGFTVSNDYSFCKSQCIQPTGQWAFNFDSFKFNEVDDWTISFYVLKTQNKHNVLVFGSEFYTIQTGDVYSLNYVGARLQYNYTHNLETQYNLNTKYHVAFVHTANNSTFSLYLDGKLVATHRNWRPFPITHKLNPEQSADWIYLDELIITPQALWTENFTPTYRYLWNDTKKIYLTNDNVAYAKV